MSAIIGIDLGTTFSAVGCVRGGLPEILPHGAERIMPSVVGISPEGNLVVGTPALNQYVLYPEHTVRSIKRFMGSGETVTLNGREYSPPEISALILRELKRSAEAVLGEAVERAVITVPAYFSDAARQATREAGELAGFQVERILNEPTAAALAYGLDKLDANEMVAVYDLGGGTFDVSIIEMNSGVMEVRASHGDTQLGGDDFDQLLMSTLAEEFVRLHGVDPRENAQARARLLRAAERAKINLSAAPFVQVREEYLLEHEGKPLHLDVEIARDTFEELILDLVEGTLRSFDQALSDAGLRASDLDRVLFVGGSTRIPLVWRMVAVHTGIEPMTEVNPDEAVALGAGVQAAIVAGEPIETILVDLTPHSLGIAVAQVDRGRLTSDRFSVVIRRNTALPTRRSEVYYAVHPSQTAINIEVYQGEASVASQNTLLGEFLFEDLGRAPFGQLPTVTVEFDLDLNGILQVSATDRNSRRVEQRVLQAAHTRLSPAELSAGSLRLSELEQYALPAPPEDSPNPLVNRAARFLENRLGEIEQLQELSSLMSELRGTYATGETARREALEVRLEEILYELEDDGNALPEDDDAGMPLFDNDDDTPYPPDEEDDEEEAGEVEPVPAP